MGLAPGYSTLHCTLFSPVPGKAGVLSMASENAALSVSCSDEGHDLSRTNCSPLGLVI